MCAAAADQAGNDGLEGGVRGKLLGFWHDSKFFRNLIVYLSVVVRHLFQNSSLVRYPRFFVSQALGPFVRDCEAERWFLCCVVRVGYWPDQPVVRSRVVAPFLSDSCFATRRGLYLYPVWVMVCGGTSYTSLSGVDVELCFVEVVWCDLPLNVLHLPSGLAECLACSGVVSDLYH
ncbi:hypothetical protein Taro_027887 [Colocasia esculenta]|uniref:Uncharacterized protein n=1 Tax=Colocasia esculenta TaxID=4460 RepID=A0A843VF17_COLES|nr:hypothetical protein [Colocasia esculenta]